MKACDLCGSDAPDAGRCATRNREACLVRYARRLERERNEARAAGAAEERARIVAMMRADAARFMNIGISLSSPTLEKGFHAVAVALRDVADRVERGET